MRQQDGHFHALTEYSLINWRHYIKLLWSVFVCKIKKGKSLTVHLPYELQHPQFFHLKNRGLLFVQFGQFLKHIFRINLYWENAPWLNTGSWDLKHGQTIWLYIPKTIEMCLDTGHLMMGCKSKKEAGKRISEILKKRGSQIKHLHLHENDLVSDKHWHSQIILTPSLIKKLTYGRTAVWEESS